MTWFELPRTPEMEVMNDVDEVQAYSSAAAQSYLHAIDNSFVQQVLELGKRYRILRCVAAGHDKRALENPRYDAAAQPFLLDVGSGPGGIPLNIARSCPELTIIGVDRSLNMTFTARQSSVEQGLAHRVFFVVGDAGMLPFRDASFDVVTSNSLLHHLLDPVSAFNEMARLVKSSGLVLLRDLRRPSRILFPLHVRWFGRYYSGLMKNLYINSVKAAYTRPELASIIQRSALSGAKLFSRGLTHFGFIAAPNHSRADRYTCVLQTSER